MAAQGVNAYGAKFDGYVDLTGLRAQRIEFTYARFEESLDLEGAVIHHPDLFGKGLEDDEELLDLDTAVGLVAARGQHLLIDKAVIIGCLRLTEARFASVYIIDSYLEALVQPHGSRGVAVSGRALHIESDLWFKCSCDAAAAADAKSGTNIIGQLLFESATIGGVARFEGISIELGLSEKHRRVFAEHQKGLTRSERQAMRAISLRNCTIGGTLTMSRYEPPLDKLGLGPAGEKDRHPEDRRFCCDGEIDLRGAIIDDDVWFEHCHVENKALARTIDLRDAKIGRTLMLRGFSKHSRGVIDLRGAYARSYRDDFEYLRGAALLFGFNVYRLLNEAKHFLTASLAVLAEIALAVATLGLFGRERLMTLIDSRERRSHWSATAWPRGLRFRLSGFVYDSFPIREAAVTIDNSDSSRMPLTGGARLRWLRHQERIWLTTKFQPQPWLQCAKVLRELGYDHQSHILLVQREKMAMRSGDVVVGEKLIRWVLVLVCGHGHAMWRLIPIGAVMFCFALFVNTIAIRSNLIRPTNGIVLVDDEYRLHGVLPTDYSALNPLSFTLQNMFPLPQVAGGSEWRACNRSQIRLSISQGSQGACVPRSCPISERQDCPKLAVLLGSSDASPAADLREYYLNLDCGARSDAGSTDMRHDDGRGRVYANVICASPETIQSLLDSPLAKWVDKLLGLLVLYYSIAINACFVILNWFSGFFGLEFEALTPRPFVLREYLNVAIASGFAARLNAFAAFVGWGIVLIAGTYAAGTLKRRE